MSCVCIITGNRLIGGGLNVHTEYKLSVNRTGVYWEIERRYADFAAFHSSLPSTLDQESFSALDGLFPHKSLLAGSFIGSFNTIVEERTRALQQYLNSVLDIANIESNSSLSVLLDYENKGKSALVISLGSSTVLKESYLNMKISYPYQIGVWSTFYTTLLRSGSLIITRTIRDNVSQALINIPLGGGDVSFIPRPLDNTAEIACPHLGLQIRIRFESLSESAYWIRSISDFVSSVEIRSSIAKNQTKQINPTQEQSATSNPLTYLRDSILMKNTTGQAQPAETNKSMKNQKHDNSNQSESRSGNNPDEMSSLFGI
eukprot:gene13835-18556_t